VLEDQDFRAQVLQAQADARSAEARETRAGVELRDAQRAFDREKMVQEKGVSTPAVLDQVTARLDGSKAALSAARSDSAAARARGAGGGGGGGRAEATVTAKGGLVDDPAEGLRAVGAKGACLAEERGEAAGKAQPIRAVQADAVGERGETKVVWVVDPQDQLR